MAETVDEEIRFKIGAEGSEQVARLLADLNKTLGGTSAALDTAAASANKVKTALPRVADEAAKSTRAIGEMQRGTQKGAVVIGQLTQAVRTMSPELAVLTGGVGRAGAALAALGSVSGGPVLFGITAAIAGFTTLAGWMKENEQRAKELADALEKDVAERAAAAAEKIARARAVMDEALSPDSSSVRSNIAKQRELESGMRNLSGQERVSAFRALGVLRDQEQAQREADVNAAALKEISDLERAHFGDSRGGGRKKEEPFKATFDPPDKDNSQRERFLFRDKGMDDFQAQSLKAAQEINQGWKQSVADRMEAESRAHEERMRLLEEEQDRVRELQGAGIEAFSAVGASGVRALAAIAKGQKVSGRQILSGIGDEMVGLGTKWLFEGLARTFLGDPSGAALMGVGSAEIAAGIALGAATAKGGKSGGGSGGSGRAMSPTASPDSGGGAAADNRPIHIHFNSTFAPSAQDGERVVQAINEARRQGRLRESFA